MKHWRNGFWISILMSTISITLQASSDLPDASRDGIETVKAWTVQHFQKAELEFSQTNKSRFNSPDYWGNEIVYKIQVDRFNAVTPSQLPELTDDNLDKIPDLRHGGNLKGITERLDYLVDLGVTTILITPVLKHDGSYHGFCTTDFTQIDPTFGSNQDFKDFVKYAHKKGLKVILDIVINHMCDSKTYYSKQASHHNCANDLEAKNWSGQTGGSTFQGDLDFSKDFFPPLKNPEFFSRCGTNSDDDMRGQGSAAIHGDFVASMFDFNTRNWDFQEIFTNLHLYWIAYADIDGFRLDAAKHVTPDFIAFLSTRSRSYAASLGKNNFFLSGEVAASPDWVAQRLGVMMTNPLNPNDRGNVPATNTNRLWSLKDEYLSHPRQKFPGMTAAYDFNHSGRSREALLGIARLNYLGEYFTSDGYNTIAGQADPRQNFSILEIHDWPRFVSGNNRHNPWKSRLGASYLLTAQGIPLIYYGQEQGFNGDCHYDSINVGQHRASIEHVCQSYDHSLNRQDMFLAGPWRLGSTVENIKRLAYIGKPLPRSQTPWEHDPYLDRTHFVYKTFRKLNHIRRTCSTLRYGKTYTRYADPLHEGLIAFSRIDSDKEMLIVLNTSSVSKLLGKIQVDANLNSTNGNPYINLLNGHKAYVEKQADGSSVLNFGNLALDGNDVAIMVHSAGVGEWDFDLETHLCKF